MRIAEVSLGCLFGALWNASKTAEMTHMMEYAVVASTQPGTTSCDRFAEIAMNPIVAAA